MCGIAGLYRPQRAAMAEPAMNQAVSAMIGSLVHRGPDAGGIWSDPEGRCVLGHRRLSIIDPSDAGAQPMANHDGRWVISFNGEIYNFEDIKPRVEAAGVRLKGRTDTEVLVEALGLWGTSALQQLDGMFAFAAFDTRSGELLLARDPFGEKPLYYTELRGGAVAFASELQALELTPGFDAAVDPNAMAEVLTFQYIGAPRSIYASVKKLRPGHWMRVDRIGRIRVGRYFQFKPGAGGFEDRSLPELADELEDILVRSLGRRLISDVPLGAFLSGGVDSSVVCALVRRKLDRPLTTFSTGFQDAPESEHLVARTFAEHLGTTHHEDVLAPDAATFLRDIGAVLDEPNADSSCLPTYLLSQFARQHVTVALSGDGGDELFGGYGRYFSTLNDLALRTSGSPATWTPGRIYYGERVLVAAEPEVNELFGFVPCGFGQHLATLRSEVDAEEAHLLCELRRSDVENYMPGAVLPKVDRMSMRHSLEVRTPYLSVELARFAERLPDSAQISGGRGKLVLRELAYRYLPREFVDLPKQGFALPLSDWARASLLKVASEMLDSEESRLRSAFGSDRIDSYMSRQRSPEHFVPYRLWGVLMLESWLRHRPTLIPDLQGGAGRRNRSWNEAA